MADRPAWDFLRPLAAIVAEVPDLAKTALSEPVHSWMGLRSRVLGQANAGERAGGHMWRIGRALERSPRFRGKSRDIRMLQWDRP